MLPDKPENSGQNIKVETGDKLLRETLATTHQALRSIANENKKLNQDVATLKKQRLFTSIGSILFLLVGLSWFAYTTYLYIDKKNSVSTPVAITSTYSTRSLSLPKTKTKTKKKKVRKPKQQAIKTQTTPKQKRKKNEVNKLIASTLLQNTRNDNNIRLDAPLDFTMRDALVIAFTRKDSLNRKKPLTLVIRSNNPFDKPIKKRELNDFESLVIYKEDFPEGVYYLELREKTKLLLSRTFTVQSPAKQNKARPEKR